MSSAVNGLTESSNGQEKETDATTVCSGKGAVILRASSSHERAQSGSPQPSHDRELSQSLEETKLDTGDLHSSEAQPSSLAAKGYRSVRPHRSSDTDAQTRPPPSRDRSFAWHPPTNPSASQLVPVPILDGVYLSAPKPYTQSMPPSARKDSHPAPLITMEPPAISTRYSNAPGSQRPQASAHAAHSPLAPRSSVPKALRPEEPAIPSCSNTGRNASHETGSERKVSSLYIASLANSTGSSAAENSTGVAHGEGEVADLEADVTKAPGTDIISSITECRKPPPAPLPVPPRPFFSSVPGKDTISCDDTDTFWTRYPVHQDMGRRVLDPQCTAADSKPMTAKDSSCPARQRRPAKRHSMEPASSPALPEVIIVPLHHFNTEREQEGTSSSPPPPLVPAGTDPTASPLTFPTLDDFIPPHLQQGAHHHPPASPDSFSTRPPPPLSSPPLLPPPVPPIPEVFQRAWEPERTADTSLTSAYPVPNEASSASLRVDSPSSFTSVGKASSVYPSTTIVNPTIVLLQHNREQQKKLNSLADPVPDRTRDPSLESTSAQQESFSQDSRWTETQGLDAGKSPARASQYNAGTSVDDMSIPLRNTERSKDWYKTMFKQIHKLTRDDDSDSFPKRHSYSEDYPVPHSKSEITMSNAEEILPRSVTFPLATHTSSLKPKHERNDWEPQDKKADTRKYRAEPKSIYEYQPGKSSAVTHEKMVMSRIGDQ